MQRCKDCKFAVYCDAECAASASATHVLACDALHRLSKAEMAFDGDADFVQFVTQGAQAARGSGSLPSMPLYDGSAEADMHADKETLRLAIAVLARYAVTNQLVASLVISWPFHAWRAQAAHRNCRRWRCGVVADARPQHIGWRPA